MVQCLDCQDWFHQRCIGDYDPEDDSDFICSTCVLTHPALLLYVAQGKLSAVYRPKEPQGESQDAPPSSVSDKPEQPILNESASADALTGVKRPNEDTELPPPSKPRLEMPEDAGEETCSKPKLLSSPASDEREFSIIGKKDWRNDLCRCEKCLDMYYAQGMLHLIDVEDVYTPEEDPNRDVSLHDAGLQALGALPHDRAILLASRYDQLRSTIRNFLEPFAKSGKTITKEDIMEHFNSSKDP
ncbi:hypothetical protein DSO57_1020569 [Entomophthora muscae]|uniref:Uncharacterized protein n=1 Tax=Entomophthora muscae TaxID=34485 RepID=A0ACC2U270_9FUNG|nr:hypothetical protein DSO57_1020569 [Entomophthora muscae]